MDEKWENDTDGAFWLHVLKFNFNLGLFCQLRVIVYAASFPWCRVGYKAKIFLSLSDALDSSSRSKEL